MTKLDIAKRVAGMTGGLRDGYGASAAGVIVSGPTVEFGTAAADSADGYVPVLFDGGAESVELACDCDVREGDRVCVVTQGGRSKLTSLAQTTKNIKAVTVETGKLYADVATIGKATIDAADIAVLVSESATVEQLKAARARVDELTAEGVSAKLVTATQGVFDEVSADAADFEAVTANVVEGRFAKFAEIDAQAASVGVLQAGAATINNLSADYAKVDFANVTGMQVGTAKMRELLAKSGWFQEVTVTGDASITGQLASVLVDGDTARFRNIYADSLRLLGGDGLYHALNVAMLPEGEAQALVSEYGEALDEGLHGSRIIAKSVTADQVDATSVRAALLEAIELVVGGSAGTHIEIGEDGIYMVGPDGSAAAYIALDDEENSVLYVERSMVLKDMRFGEGKWKWYKRANENMSLKWIG